MNVSEFLAAQHRRIEELFEEILCATEADAVGLVDRLATTLTGHMVAEQEIFYPVCITALEDNSPLLRAFDDHGSAAYELRRLLACQPGDPSFASKVRGLRDLLVRHVSEEARSLLPDAERTLGRESSANLATEMQARFDAQVRAGYREYMSLEPEAPTEVRLAG